MSAEKLKSAATGQVAVNPVKAFSSVLDRMKPQLALALPKHLTADRMARLALTAFSSTPALQQCTTDSMLSSLMVAAQMGLEPGIGGQGYLIPYKRNKKVGNAWTSTWECQFIPGWKGLVDLVARAGRATVWTGAVRAGDEFDYQLGDSPFCKHKPGDANDSEPFTHVYAIGRVRDAAMPVIEVWSRAKIEKHLKQYNKVGDGHYAKANENNLEMYGRKVALLQVIKYMPQSIELANAITVSDAGEAGKGVVLEGDFVTVIDPDTGEITGADPTNDPSKAGGKPEVDAGPKPLTYAEARDLLASAKDVAAAGAVLERTKALPDDQRADLSKFFDERFPE